MSFLLKIVGGPNRGAEIALVDGVSVTLGKAEDCDIVLADSTLPDAPFSIEASSSGVTLDGTPLEPFSVKTAGATSFAVGPSDAPWGELSWPKPEVSKEEAPEAAEEPEKAPEAPEPEKPDDGEAAKDAGEDTKDEGEGKRRGGCLGCLIAAIVLLFILAGLAWFFREQVRPHAESLWQKARGMVTSSQTAASPGENNGAVRDAATQLADIAAKFGLSSTNINGRAALTGNLRTRAERLAATAEAYGAQPGVELDLSDDESFRTAAEDALFTLTEGELKVTAATNRFLSVKGMSQSPMALKKTLEALNADLPKLRGLDVAGVRFGGDPRKTGTGGDAPVGSLAARNARKASNAALPVCGILTTPYPCLVMKNGQRVLEGASIGDCTILRISADSVVVTNASGRFTWKP